MRARQLAAGKDMDTISGTDHTERVKLSNISGADAAFASDKEVRAKRFKQYVNSLGELSLWL